jgi:hypothetical protein
MSSRLVYNFNLVGLTEIYEAIRQVERGCQLRVTAIPATPDAVWLEHGLSGLQARAIKDAAERLTDAAAQFGKSSRALVEEAARLRKQFDGSPPDEVA